MADPFSSVSHFIAAGAALVGAFFLLARGKGNGTRVFSLVTFSFSLVFLFSMSAVYHLLERGGGARYVLAHLDHAAIWVLIAGTFTPIHTILFRGLWRWGVLALIWTLAITGLVLKTIYFTFMPEWMGLTFYIGLGWFGILTGIKFHRAYKGEEFHWLWLGGVFYSIGGVLDYLRWPNIIDGVIGGHEVFHIFVNLGALSHWIFVYKWAAHPIWDLLTFHVKIYPDGHLIAKARGEDLQVEAKSKEELHRKLKESVREKYHTSINPQIRLKYFQEEFI